MKWDLSIKEWIEHIKIILEQQQPALAG